MPSPPKPWERGTVAAAAASPNTMSSSAVPTNSAPAPATSSAPPSIPERPAAITNASTTLTNPVTNTFANTYNSPYSSTPYSSYSPYNRFGSTYSPYGMNSTYGGGMGLGSYGSYGSYGGYGMNGMNGMFGGMPGMPGYGMPGVPGMDPMNPSLSQTLESTTQHTFALIQSIVQTFTGVAQMLESTFVATHSSFFAMVGVIDQFSQLRNALGSVLGLFGLVRWMRELVTGQHSPSALRSEFKNFVNGRPVQGPNGAPVQRPSKKPLIFFLIAIFGIPYAMHKLVKILVERQQQQAAEAGLLPGGVAGATLPPLDPSQLTFARALYQFDASSPAELNLKENEIVAVMGKLDPATGQEVDPRLEVSRCLPLISSFENVVDDRDHFLLQVEGSEWWRGRTREGREGWFPKKWVQVLERKAADVKAVE